MSTSVLPVARVTVEHFFTSVLPVAIYTSMWKFLPQCGNFYLSVASGKGIDGIPHEFPCQVSQAHDELRLKYSLQKAQHDIGA